MRVVSEEHPHAHAVSIGVWVEYGTRNEPSKYVGITHFLEHLVFKGTKTRSAFEIAKSLEELGGELNAFTTRDSTCFHAYVLKRHWREALDVLADLIQNMKVSQKDFDLERSVVIQEIAMSEDAVDEIIYDWFLEKAFGNKTIGRSILGTEKTLGHLTLRQTEDFYKRVYHPKRLILTVAGGISHEEICLEAQKKFKIRPAKSFSVNKDRPIYKPFVDAVTRPIEQTHLLFGLPVSSFQDKDRFEAFVLNAFLGGGMTSKLFQEVREKKGLAYSIYSSLNTFEDFGMINIQASGELKNSAKILSTIMKEIKLISSKGISDNEVELFKRQIVGQLLLGADDLENRMQSIAVNEMIFGVYRPVEQIIDELNAVNAKSIQKFLDKWWNLKKMSLLVVGPDENANRELLAMFKAEKF